MERWLESLAHDEGMLAISAPRRFAHDELKYDEQYDNSPTTLQAGRGLVALLQQLGVDLSAAVLEVGCGTGVMSLGLAEKLESAILLLTDASPEFVAITRRKLSANHLLRGNVRLALLRAEDMSRLPDAEFSLIALRSTLHHVLNADAFVRDAARALRPGGVLAFQEPCFEGYLLMGAIAQFFPNVAERAKRPLTAEQIEQVDLFVRTMQFYARRDVDKSTAEDKHLFRVDEIMTTGRAYGLQVEFIANRTFEHFSVGPNDRPSPDRFTPFFRNYLKYCMSFDDALVTAFDEVLAPHCKFVEESSAGCSGPYLHGVFICRRN